MGGGGTYTVIKLTWVNDGVNDPVFKNLFVSIYNFNQRLKSTIMNNQKEISKKKETFKTLYLKFKTDHFNSSLKTDIDKEMEDRKRNYQRYSSSGISPESIKRIINTLYNTNAANMPAILEIISDLYTKQDTAANNKQQDPIPSILYNIRTFKELLNLAHEIDIRIDITDNYLSKFDEYIKLITKNKDELKMMNDNTKLQIYQTLTTNSEYTYLNNIINLIKPFLSKSFSNPAFNSLFTSFKNNPNDLFEFAENVQHFISNKPTTPTFDKKMLEIGVITNIEKTPNAHSVAGGKNKDHTNQFNADLTSKTYEINIQLDVIKGLLTEKTINDIKCMFSNYLLINQYTKLNDKKKTVARNNIFLTKFRPLINVDIIKKDIIDKKMSDKKLSTSIETKPSYPKKMGGSSVKNRKTRKYRTKLMGGFQTPTSSITTSPTVQKPYKSRKSKKVKKNKKIKTLEIH